MSIPAHEAMATVLCKFPNCDREALTAHGTYAKLCSVHREARRSELHSIGRSPSQSGGRGAEARVASLSSEGFEQKAKALVLVGRRLDRAVAAYQPARSTLEDAMRTWREALAELAQQGGPEA